ncbi:hypothetical protein Tco_1053855 [Tanacetum coccineum]|uniref:Uncharacterized protein n=1 Tax=Tanacetum coccineum TaxID=301880 RepID=A0ABQ5GV34_9ASTR
MVINLQNFSNPLFDADDDFSSSDDKSFSDEDVPKKIYSNPLFDEEIISTKIDPHHFNVESDLIESLLNRDILIVSSPKSDSLLEEFSDELPHIDLISPEINEADFDPEEEIRLVEKLLYEIIPLVTVVGNISELYVHMPNVLPTLLTLSPMFDTLLLFSSENDDKVFNLGILASNEEKSHHLLSHRGFNPSKIISDFSKSPMMTHGDDIPILDVPFLHFYPP